MSSGRPEISLCMIVRDEADHLERCLTSARDVVTEMIVVDTGSTDGTQELARRWGAKVVEAPWKRDFAAARNLALALATKPWILVLDADEEWVPPPGGEAQLSEWLSDGAVQGYMVRIVSQLDEAGDEAVTDSVCRLFRNDPRIRFAGMIHEEAASSIEAYAPDGLRHIPLEIRHYGYLPAVIERKGKNRRNAELIRTALERTPDDLRLRYAMGTEWFQLARYDQALPWFESVLPHVSAAEPYASDLLLKTAYTYRAVGHSETALSLSNVGLAFYPDFADLLDLRAALLLDHGRWAEALACANRARAAGSSSFDRYTSLSGAGGYRSLLLAGMASERLLRWEAAAACYAEALELNADYTPALERLLPLLAALSSEEAEGSCGGAGGALVVTGGPLGRDESGIGGGEGVSGARVVANCPSSEGEAGAGVFGPGCTPSRPSAVVALVRLCADLGRPAWLPARQAAAIQRCAECGGRPELVGSGADPLLAAVVLWQQGRRAEAAAIWADAASGPEPASAADALLLLGAVASAAGDDAGAAAHWAEASRRDGALADAAAFADASQLPPVAPAVAFAGAAQPPTGSPADALARMRTACVRLGAWALWLRLLPRPSPHRPLAATLREMPAAHRVAACCLAGITVQQALLDALMQACRGRPAEAHPDDRLLGGWLAARLGRHETAAEWFAAAEDSAAAILGLGRAWLALAADHAAESVPGQAARAARTTEATQAAQAAQATHTTAQHPTARPGWAAPETKCLPLLFD